jgi:hypothetical protein
MCSLWGEQDSNLQAFTGVQLPLSLLGRHLTKNQA